MTRPTPRAFALIAAAALSACAAAPELDGRPTAAIRAADLRPGAAEAAPAQVWGLDFGDPGLRRMLSEADVWGLDVAAARARFRAADLTLAQSVRNGWPTPSSSIVLSNNTQRFDTSISFEPDLSGRFAAALQSARLERQATGIDLWLARRTLAQEVVNGWVALAEARTARTRLTAQIADDDKVLALLAARIAAGESTGAERARRQQSQIRDRAALASAQTRIAVAEARLRALGVRTLPASISLRNSQRPAIAQRTDLARTTSAPVVCAAWLRFRASDASRAETLAASRPRLVLTSSASATARTLAGLISGNAVSLVNSLRLDGTLLDNGAARTRLDQARLSVAQAEIGWLQARSKAEVTALEAIAAQQTAEAGLNAALAAWRDARANLDRVRSRQQAGIADSLELAEAERALTSAQREIDNTRAEAFRAAATVHAALPPALPDCAVTESRAITARAGTP